MFNNGNSWELLYFLSNNLCDGKLYEKITACADDTALKLSVNKPFKMQINV